MEKLPPHIRKTGSGKYGGRIFVKGKELWTGSKETVQEAVEALDQLVKEHNAVLRSREDTPANAKSLVGQKFGHLTVVKDSGKRYKDGGIVWHCQCDCGSTTDARGADLLDGSTKSCGHPLRKLVKTNVSELRDLIDRYDHTNPEILNQRTPRNNTGGYTNISVRQTRSGGKMYIVTVGFKRKIHYGGSYAKLEDAIKARDELRDKLWHGTLERFKKDGRHKQEK